MRLGRIGGSHREGGGGMRRTRFLRAMAVTVWAAVLGGSQAAAPVLLSGPLRAHVKDERFGIVTSIAQRNRVRRIPPPPSR